MVFKPQFRNNKVPGPSGNKTYFESKLLWAVWIPRVSNGSKYSMFKGSGPKKTYPEWFLGPETLNIGYLDPLGKLRSKTPYVEPSNPLVRTIYDPYNPLMRVIMAHLKHVSKG